MHVYIQPTMEEAWNIHIPKLYKLLKNSFNLKRGDRIILLPCYSPIVDSQKIIRELINVAILDGIGVVTPNFGVSGAAIMSAANGNDNQDKIAIIIVNRSLIDRYVRIKYEQLLGYIDGNDDVLFYDTVDSVPF